MEYVIIYLIRSVTLIPYGRNYTFIIAITQIPQEIRAAGFCLVSDNGIPICTKKSAIFAERCTIFSAIVLSL